MRKSKPLIFTVIVQLLFVSVLLSTEYGLRSTDEYKAQFEPFVQTGPEGSYLNFNSKWATQFFNTFQPSTGYFPFPKNKPSDEFRIFCLGGSSTAGFPYSYHNSFPMYLREILQLTHPEKRIRVINLGQTAINSFQIAELSAELGEYEPDAFVLYAGHNEFYGAMGGGSSESGWGSSPIVKRLWIDANQLGLVYFGKKLFGFQAPESKGESGTTMENMIQNANITQGSTLFSTTVETFSENLESIIEYAGDQEIPIYTATIMSNVSGQAPLGVSDSALTHFAKATDLLESDSLSNEVKKRFILAKEWDPIRFRAPNAINSVIRDITSKYELPLVELDEWSQNQPGFWLHPNRWFTDHLHPTDSVYLLIAQQFAETITTHHPTFIKRSIPNVLSPLDPIDSIFAQANIDLLTNRFPFTNSSDVNEHTQFKNRLKQRLSKGSKSEQLVSMMLMKRRSPAQVYLEATNSSTKEEQLRLYRGLLYWQPFNQGLHSNAFTSLVKQIDFPEEGLFLASDALLFDDSIPLMNVTGALFLQRNEPTYAEPWLDRAYKRDSFYKPVLYNLARTHLLFGDTLTSKKYFEKLNRKK